MLLWVSGRGQVIERCPDGKPVRLLSVVADITQRKQAEDALKASEARFRMLAEAIPNIAWMASPDGVVIWHSPRWNDFSGIAGGQASEQDTRSRVHPEDRLRTANAWRTALANQQTYEIEHRLRDRDGVYRWFLNRAVLVRGDGAHVVAWVGTGTNIDALKAIEEKLTRYVGVADAAHDGLISITPDGVIETWNKGAERLFDYDSVEAVGQTTSVFVPHDEVLTHQEMMSAVRQVGTAGPKDVKRRHKNGNVIDVSISMTGVTDAKGELVAISKVVHDISGRLETERRLQLLNRELAHWVKNTYSVLLAVMRQTLRNSSSLQQFGDVFTGRVRSMATARRSAYGRTQN